MYLEIEVKLAWVFGYVSGRGSSGQNLLCVSSLQALHQLSHQLALPFRSVKVRFLYSERRQDDQKMSAVCTTTSLGVAHVEKNKIKLCQHPVGV